jgi:hypothetical protein
MTNRSDESVPGVRVTSAPMMHSMDFHASMVSPHDKYQSIAPGQTIEFEFTLNYPGVFMYHCGTPMVLEHIASGTQNLSAAEIRQFIRYFEMDRRPAGGLRARRRTRALKELGGHASDQAHV